MGHHPSQIVTGNAVQATGTGLSPASWLFISIAVLIIGFIIYKLSKGGIKK